MHIFYLSILWGTTGFCCCGSDIAEFALRRAVGDVSDCPRFKLGRKLSKNEMVVYFLIRPEGGDKNSALLFFRPGPRHKWPFALSNALKIAE